MRFMMLVKSSAEAEAGILPTEQELSEMGAYNEQLIKAGILLAADGLKASSKGTRIRYSGGKFKVIDGPFAETKELVAGYWVIQAKSKEEAIAWARRVPFKDGEIEVRPFYELDDFPVDPAEKEDVWRKKEEEFRAAGPPQPVRKPGDERVRYIGFLKADKATEGPLVHNEKLMAEMGAFVGELIENGVYLGGDGLKPTAQGVRVRFSNRKPTVIDGPFTETKELVAGYAILLCKSKEEAIEQCKRFVKIHTDGVGEPEGEVEIREMFELEDFPQSPAEKPGGWRDLERGLRDRTNQ